MLGQVVDCGVHQQEATLGFTDKAPCSLPLRSLNVSLSCVRQWGVGENGKARMIGKREQETWIKGRRGNEKKADNRKRSCWENDVVFQKDL